MEDQTKKIRIWLLLLALFAGFSTPTLYSQNPIQVTTSSINRGIDPVLLMFNCIDGHPGDTICIPVTVENFTDIVIIQAEIIWNSDVLDFIKVQNPGTPNINVVSDFNHSGPNALKFIPLNLNFNGEDLPDGTVLFEICFRIIGAPGTMSCVDLRPSQVFPFEVADVNGVVPADSVPCCMTVQNALNLVGFVTSCGPDIVGNNGSIDVSIFGGAFPYSITWLETVSGNTGGPVIVPGEGGNTVLDVPAGNYIITITDSGNNSVMYTAEVDTLGLSVLTTIKQPTCYKFDNGIITIEPMGGSAPFSYLWESMTDPSKSGSGFIRNPPYKSTVTSLADGIYSITVVDNNQCEVIVLDTLLNNPFVFTVNSLVNATCNGSANGLINLSISGATPDVDGNYLIQGSTFSIVTNSLSIGLLNPGEYCITVSDEVAQCDTVYCFNIGYTDTISATVTVADVNCFGGADGTVTLRGLTNGVFTPPYDYFIYDHGILETSQTGLFGNFTYTSLAPGDYAAVIMNASGCISDSIYFTVNEPLPLSIEVDSLIPDNCLPSNTGDVWFTITNGTAPYILDTDQGFQDGDTIFNIGTGNHVVTVTDANGCTATLPLYMPDFEDNEEADISFQIDGIPCEGGYIYLFFQGQPITNPNIGINWSNGEINDTILITETDTLSVTIAIPPPIGCLLYDTIQIDCEVKLDIDITIEQPLCGDGALGGPYTATVIADTSNATAPVTWYWSFPDTTTTGIYTGLEPGKYYVTVVDANDSTAVDSFEIIAPNTLNITFNSIDSVSCPDVCDGLATITAGNGDPTLDYFLYWDQVNPMADTGIVFNINNLCAGINLFTVSQDGICFYIDSIEILAPDSIDISLVQEVDASCFGASDGSLEVLAIGGTPGYTYSWTGGPVNDTYTGIPAGTYHVIATDSKNCMKEDSFIVNQPDTLIADVDTSGTIQLSCGGSNDGVITLEVSGGNIGGYTYTWNPNVSDKYQAVNLAAGQYLVTVTDTRGCTDTTSYTLVSPLPVNAVWPVINDPDCFGDSTLFTLTDVTGGNGNYLYTINGGVTFEIGDPVFLPAGIYIFSVFDDRGCSDDTTYMVTEPNPILLSLGPDDPVIDLGDSLYITGTVEQSDNLITDMIWTSIEPMSCPTCDGTWVFNELPTLYTWTVTDENGCTASASILVNVDYDRDVFFPNIFTPNNDGRNDDFKIYTGLGVESINYFRIYDRWGNLIHEEQNLMPNAQGAGKWDGSFDGEPVNPGVYLYIVEIAFIDDATLTYTGDITLVK